MSATPTLMAQQGTGKSREEHRAEIQSLKIAFMTQALSLTSAESERFWPVYNEYWRERGKLAHQKHTLYDKIESQVATQAEIDQFVGLEQSEAALIAKYAARIAKVTSVDKAAKTFVAEDKFKGTLLRRTQMKK